MSPIETQERRGLGIIPLGTVRESLSRLYPAVPSVYLSEMENVLVSLQPLCSVIDRRGSGALYVRGSSGKRLILESVTREATPQGWETPQKIWKEILRDSPDSPDADVFGPKTFTEHHPECDVAFILKRGVKFETVAKTIAEKVDAFSSKPTFHHWKYATIELIDIAWPDTAIELQLHALPAYTDWSFESRTSPMFPFSESLCGAFINGSRIYTDNWTQAILGSSFVTLSFRNAELAQAMVAVQRHAINRFWYDVPQARVIAKQNTVGPYVNFRQIIQDATFWKQARSKAEKFPDRMAARASEIAVNNLFLLTCCPEFFNKREHTQFLKQLPLYQNMLEYGIPPMNIPEYSKKFRDGTLTASESGPIQYMKYFGLPDIASLQALLTPISLA